MTQKQVWNYLKTAIVFAVFLILFIYIYQNIGELKKYSISFNFTFIILSFLFVVIYLFNQYLIWHILTLINKCNIDFKESLYYRVLSEFGKYIPGKIYGYALLLYEYGSRNKSKATIAYCMFLEFLCSSLASIIVFLCSLLFLDFKIEMNLRIIAIVLLFIITVCIHPKILEALVNKVLFLFKKELINISTSYFQILKIVCLYIINLVIFGFSFFFLIKSIYPIELKYFLFLAGSTALAGIIGLLVIIIPSGLGVREGILTLALKQVIPGTIAGIISIISRIWLTIGEISIYSIILIVSKLRKFNFKYISTN